MKIRLEFITVPAPKARVAHQIYVKSLRVFEKQRVVGGSFMLTDGTVIRFRYEKGKDRYVCSLPKKQADRVNRLAVVYPIIDEMLYGEGVK